MYDITSCIVTYNTNENELLLAIKSFLNTSLNVKLYISDNSMTDKLRSLIVKINDERIEYMHNKFNGGFGWGHNRILDKIKNKSKYHLILNPDISFNVGVLEKLFEFMKNNKDVGNVMPMVRYPNGEVQYLCKLLPTPKDLMLRKFCPIKSIVEKSNYKYEMRESGYNKIIDVPSLSGCFMFLRTNEFIKINGFDESFFMYMEDIDLNRRIGENTRTVFYPYVEIIHTHAKESYKNKKLLVEHIKSAIKYFWKWR